MGLLNFIFGNSNDDNNEEVEEMETELHEIYGYSKKELANMTDEEKIERWYEEDAEDGEQ